MKKIATYTGIALMRLVSLIPFPVLYFISGILSFWVYHIVGYRRKVVEVNLIQSFPEKTKSERKALAKKYYRYLCDLIVETVKTGSMTAEELSRRMEIKNPELVNSFYEQHRSVIIMAIHYGNWEWLLHMPLRIRHHTLFVYKPIRNQLLDQFLNSVRERYGGETVSMSLALRKLLEAEKMGQPVMTWLAADQAPPWNHPFWTTFMNQETMFFNGPAKLAQRFDQPVLFQQVRRISRGYYETWFEVLVENPREVSEDTIINTYVRKAETVIRNEPLCYLWSHRRWKYKKPGDKPAY